MVAWLRENAEWLNVLGNLGMLAIWLLYLHLFYLTFQRQRQPNLLIHQANGFDLQSLCVLANMSASHVHVAALLVDARRGDAVAAFRPRPNAPDPLAQDDPLRTVHEGPLGPGSYFALGSFRDFVAEAKLRLPDDAPDEPLELTIRIVAFVGPELHPTGARRTFTVERDAGGAEVRPRSLVPEQFSTRRRRRIAQRWLEEATALERSAVVTYEEGERSVERLGEELEARAEEERERAEGEPER